MLLPLPFLHTIEYITFCYETLILFAKRNNPHHGRSAKAGAPSEQIRGHPHTGCNYRRSRGARAPREESGDLAGRPRCSLVRPRLGRPRPSGGRRSALGGDGDRRVRAKVRLPVPTTISIARAPRGAGLGPPRAKRRKRRSLPRRARSADGWPVRWKSRCVAAGGWGTATSRAGSAKHRSPSRPPPGCAITHRINYRRSRGEAYPTAPFPWRSQVCSALTPTHPPSGSGAGAEWNPLEGKLHKSLCQATAPDRMKASIWFRSALKTIQRAISMHPARSRWRNSGSMNTIKIRELMLPRAQEDAAERRPPCSWKRPTRPPGAEPPVQFVPTPPRFGTLPAGRLSGRAASLAGIRACQGIPWRHNSQRKANLRFEGRAEVLGAGSGAGTGWPLAVPCHADGVAARRTAPCRVM